MEIFKKPQDMRYTRFLAELHRSSVFDWYLEVGCRTGRTFSDVRGKTIAVDPFFRITTNVIGDKPALFIFQNKSDDFFASDFLENMKIKLSFSFLDGMHLIEYLLRDFINAEKNSAPDSVIAIHDCCPFSFEMTTRDLESAPKDAWTGDVWKLIPILREFRPDLNITVLGCRPTGMVLVDGLDPESNILKSKYENIIKEWQNLSLESYGAKRFYEGIEYMPCKEFLSSHIDMFKKISLGDDVVRKPEFVSL